MASVLERLAIRRILKGMSSPCIVELGARTAEDECWIRSACTVKPHYLMVEPDMRNCQMILDHPLGIFLDRKLILGAVTSYDGLTIFYSSESPDGSRTSSSIYKPTGHFKAFPDIKFPETAQTVVPCYMLDTIFKKEWLEKIDLLWVDIQGAERDMILGGTQSLERTHYLFMEVEGTELYQGQALREELLGMLSGWN